MTPNHREPAPVLLVRFAVRHPWLTLILHLVVGLGAGFGVTRLRQTDDLLQFVPAGDVDVTVFREVSDAYGALQVAIVGVEAPAGQDVFSAEVLGKIDQASKAMGGVSGVDRVVSMATLPDFVSSELGVRIEPLVDLARDRPSTKEGAEAVRRRVMGRSHVVGNFVSRDGRAALMLVFLAQGVSARQVAKEVRAICKTTFGELRTIFGGAPFATATIYEETDADLRNLTPIAALLILGVILVAFRDPVGVALTIFTVAWASLVVLGVMGYLGEPYTVISGTLPVILFASGSSYAVHLLGRYFSDGGAAAGPDAVLKAAAVVAAPVAIAGATTSSGFFSFLVMDIRPMRTFGLEAGAGVLLTYLASMTVVPAVIQLWPRRHEKPIDTGALGSRLAWLTRWGQRRRRLLLGGALLLGALTIGPMLRVEVHMDPRSFFSKGSDPWNAEEFLDQRFGGSQYIQVELRGDMTDPATLREVQRLAQFAAAQPGVSQISSVVEPLSLVNEAMGGGRRLPETRAQVTNLLMFVEGEASLKSLLKAERDGALVHIRVGSRVKEVLAALEGYLATTLDHRPGAPSEARVVERLGWLAAAGGKALLPGSAERVVATLRQLTPDRPERWAPLRREVTLAVLAGEGEIVPRVESPEERERIAHLIALASPEGERAFVALAPSPEEGTLAWSALRSRIHERARREVVAGALAQLGTKLDPEAEHWARQLLGDLIPEQPIVAAGREISARIAGEPVLDRGFARSVGKNQERSLIVSLLVVLVLMFALFRSLYLAATSMFASTLWLACVFGAMGLLKVPIDISTSLVASIATGAGSDFAMHYLWYFKHRSHEEVVRFVGPVMVISGLLVSAGFAVLAIGRSQPMKMFGSLAALAMLGAFLLTFVLVPALLRRQDQKEAPPVEPTS